MIKMFAIVNIIHIFTSTLKIKTMTTKQAIKKCQKKAWIEIKNISNAKTMNGVEMEIQIAIEKTFGVYNKGILAIQMRKLGQMGNIESMPFFRIRRQNFNNHVSLIKKYLFDMIPSKLYTTKMYMNMYRNM